MKEVRNFFNGDLDDNKIEKLEIIKKKNDFVKGEKMELVLSIIFGCLVVITGLFYGKFTKEGRDK